MKIIEPSATLVDGIDPKEILKKIELCGRVCYQSLPREDSAENFVRMLIKRGHESVLEHVNLTFRIVCDRGVSHELVRHRIASYSQESTRYVKYNSLKVVAPFDIDEDNPAHATWLRVMKTIENAYAFMIANGIRPEIARSILPNGLKSELCMTANLREWRHILKLRTDKAAHPQMRQIANQILDTFKKFLPVIVEDIDHA